MFLIGKIACKILGPKSRAGFKAGPVGPPNEATNAITNKPTPMKPAPWLPFSKIGECVIDNAQKNRMNDPKNSFTKPLNLLFVASVVENVPKIASGFSVAS